MRPYNNLKRVRYNEITDPSPHVAPVGGSGGPGFMTELPAPLTEQSLADFIIGFKTALPTDMTQAILGMALDHRVNPNLDPNDPNLGEDAGEEGMFRALGADIFEVGRWAQMLGVGLDSGQEMLIEPTTDVHELAFVDVVQELESGELEGIGPILTSHTLVGDVFFSVIRRYVELQMKHFTSQHLGTLEALKDSRTDCNGLDANEKFTCVFELNFAIDGIKSMAKIYNNLIIKMGGTADNSLTDAIEQLIQSTSEFQNPGGFCESLGYIKSSDSSQSAPDIIPPLSNDVKPKILKYKEQVTTRNYVIIGLIGFLLLFIYLTVKKK